jgi:hypothetical protein
MDNYIEPAKQQGSVHVFERNKEKITQQYCATGRRWTWKQYESLQSSHSKPACTLSIPR